MPDAAPELLPCDEPGMVLHLRRGEHFSLLSARVHSAAGMDNAAFQRQTTRAYQLIARHLAQLSTPHPVRFWNRIPDLLRPAGEALNRYMVFNVGRYEAFRLWYGSVSEFPRTVATASGVGHASEDLVIHALAARVPGEAVDNPRQIRPFNYSRTWGPRPPCFSRATRITTPAGTRMLLVGGTASVRGEASVHVGDLQAQLRETFINLATLTHNADGHSCVLRESDDLRGPLARYRELRVYHPDPTHADPIVAAITNAFNNLRRVELVHTDLCRDDLLVEIEGLAECAAR